MVKNTVNKEEMEFRFVFAEFDMEEVTSEAPKPVTRAYCVKMEDVEGLMDELHTFLGENHATHVQV